MEISLFGFSSKYGLIGAGISIAAALLFFILDSETPQFLNIAIILGVLLWGQLAYRKVGLPPISYGETLGLGVLVILWFGIPTTIYGMIHWSFIETDIGTRVLQQAEQALNAQGLSERDAKAAMEAQKMMIGPIVTPLVGFVSVMIIGTLMGLITSIFTRRANSE